MTKAVFINGFKKGKKKMYHFFVNLSTVGGKKIILSDSIKSRRKLSGKR